MRHIFWALCFLCVESLVAMPQQVPANHPAKNQKGTQASPAGPPSPAGPTVAGQSEDFVIGPEDVLEISVWREPDLTSRGVVRSDGKIGIRLLNDVPASGLTTRQLRDRLQEAFAKFVAEPVVSVIVAEVHSQTVHIIGNVGRPGMYPLGGPLTIMEILARAGGLSEFAKKEDIAIVRSEGGKSHRVLFNYKAFVDGNNLQQNILLRNGDVIVVP